MVGAATGREEQAVQLEFNTFLVALSSLIDFVEMDVLGVTSNHGRRVAYISARLAERLGMTPPQVFDIVAVALLHDNGLSEEALTTTMPIAGTEKIRLVEGLREHCDIGERNVAGFPFLTDVAGVLRFHHERYDGRGFFGLSGDRIPVMAQIIGMADFVDFLFNFERPDPANRDRITTHIAEMRHTRLAPGIVDLFLDVARAPAFWLDLQNDFIAAALAERTPKFSQDLPWPKVLEVCRVFSRIVDCKSHFTQRHSSGLEDKAARMAEAYGLAEEETLRLRIAASLHDIGKLAMPNAILDKPGRLTSAEFAKMQEHTYYTRRCLEQVHGFAEITDWAANHHERLDGKGYPLGLPGGRQDRNARLMACLDVYQALTEERPYRAALGHAEAMAILGRQADAGTLDRGIVADIDRTFG